MRKGGTDDDRLVVTEHVGSSLDRHTEVAEHGAQIDDLLSCNACCNKL